MKHFILSLVLFFFGFSALTYAQSTGLNFDLDSFIKPNNFSSTINLLLSLSSISIFPFFLMSTTSFLRTVIVLSMIRQAIGTQQAPPNSVIISLSLFVTIFVMTPAWNKINETAVKPYQDGQITQSVAFDLHI